MGQSSCCLASKWFWLRVSHEVGVKMSLKLQLSEGLTRAGESTFEVEKSLEFNIRKLCSKILFIL